MLTCQIESLVTHVVISSSISPLSSSHSKTLQMLESIFQEMATLKTLAKLIKKDPNYSSKSTKI
jgi:hypothetical protein